MPVSSKSGQTGSKACPDASQLGYGLNDDFYFTLVGCTNVAGERALAEHFGPGFPLVAFRERWAELWREEVQVARHARTTRHALRAPTPPASGRPSATN